MIAPTLFDPLPPEPDPKKDDAPTDIGDGVRDLNSHPKSTKPRRRTRVQGTSREAYRSLGPSAGTQADLILGLIVGAGPQGLTDAEGQALTGLGVQSYTGRRNGLLEDGYVRDSGLKRLTPAGRKAIVWIACNLAPPTTIPGGASDTAAGSKGGAA